MNYEEEARDATAACAGRYTQPMAAWLRQHDARLLREVKELATISVYHESGVRRAVGVDELERRAREIEIGEKP